MLSAIARVMLTASAIVPVGFTYAWVAYVQDDFEISLIAAAVSVAAVITLSVVRTFGTTRGVD